MGQTLTIDCDTCVNDRTEVCDDCVVSFILGPRAARALVVNVEEAREVRRLARAGLVPPLRHESRAV